MLPTILLVGLSLATPALAHPGGHGEEHGAPPPSSTTTASAPVVVPAQYAEVVDAIRVQATTAGSALEGQKIVDLHRAVRAMTDLAAALPAKAEGLSAEGKAKVNAKTSSLHEQIEALVLAADKGNFADGKTALAAITADLDALAAVR